MRAMAAALLIGLAAPAHHAPALVMSPAQDCPGITPVPDLFITQPAHHSSHGIVNGRIVFIADACPPLRGYVRVQLQYLNSRHAEWLTMDEASVNVGGMVPGNHRTALTEAPCISGRWRMHYYGKATTSDGQPSSVNRYYPRRIGHYFRCPSE